MSNGSTRFGITGLPPALAEIDQFLADKSPDPYEKMVDRYLASPHYGERLGKFESAPRAAPTRTGTSTSIATGRSRGSIAISS